MQKVLRHLFLCVGLVAAIGLLAARGQESVGASQGSAEKTVVSSSAQASATEAVPEEKVQTAAKEKDNVKEQKIKIAVNGKVLHARLEDNATTRALIQKMPMTLPMSDLYSREMCYRYGDGALPTENLRSDHYEVGDICYWPPRGSLVILYAQNGEEFERQQVGHIDSGVEIFEHTGDAKVTFELEE